MLHSFCMCACVPGLECSKSGASVATVFRELPDEDEDPEYYEFTSAPLDLNDIQVCHSPPNQICFHNRRARTKAAKLAPTSPFPSLSPRLFLSPPPSAALTLCLPLVRTGFARASMGVWRTLRMMCCAWHTTPFASTTQTQPNMQRPFFSRLEDSRIGRVCCFLVAAACYTRG